MVVQLPPPKPMTLSSLPRSRSSHPHRRQRGGWRCCSCCTPMTTTSLFLLLSILIIIFMIVTNVRLMIQVKMEPISSVSSTSSLFSVLSSAAAVSFGRTGGAVTATTTALDQPQLQIRKEQIQKQQQQQLEDWQRGVPYSGGKSDTVTTNQLGEAKLKEDVDADDDNDVCRNIPSLDSLHELATLSQQQQQDENKTYPYQFLIDFAVIGFSKCGTTSLNEWLGGNHPEIVMPPGEDQFMFRKRSLHDVVNNTLYPRYKQYWCMKLTREVLQREVHMYQRKVYKSRTKYVQQYNKMNNNNSSSSSSSNGEDTYRKTYGNTTSLSAMPVPTNTIKPPYFGFKSPNEILTGNALETMQTHFPRTKLIVGIRHPILWFQSFYNFRTVDYYRPLRGNVAKFYVGPCIHDEHVCTDHAQYHLFLSKLFHPPTYLSSSSSSSSSSSLMVGRGEEFEGEQQLLQQTVHRQHRRLMNPVFLYETNQLRAVESITESDGTDTNTSLNTTGDRDYDDNNNNNEQATRLRRRRRYEYVKQQQQRQDQFQEDLANFLGLQGTKLSSIPHHRPGSNPGSERRKKHNAYRLRKFGIDICKPKYDDVRAVLLEHSINVYNFLYDHIYRSSSQVDDDDGNGNSSSNKTKKQLQQNQNFHVTISSPDYFLELIESYKYDPCLPRRNNTKTTTISTTTAAAATSSTQ